MRCEACRNDVVGCGVSHVVLDGGPFGPAHVAVFCSDRCAKWTTRGGSPSDYILCCGCKRYEYRDLVDGARWQRLGVYAGHLADKNDKQCASCFETAVLRNGQKAALGEVAHVVGQCF